MPLIRGRPAEAGYAHIVGPDDSDLIFIRFGLLSLPDAASFGLAYDGLETVLVILGGRCDVKAGGAIWEDIGERSNVFAGKPTAVYLPAGESLVVTGRGEVEIAVCAAPAKGGAEPKLVTPEEVRVREVGQGTFRREIYDIAVPETVCAERLLVGETYNLPGLWSSYPPHKHEAHSPPDETKLEELYHYRLKPSQGFGVQRIYGDGVEETHTVRDRDTVTIAKGFHPVAAAPGYHLYYLWVLAGERRALRPREDPAHSWVSRES